MSTELTINLLASPTVLNQDQHEIIFPGRKELALLAYLAMAPDEAHSREWLLALLWPDLPADDARNNLRVTLYRLRKALGKGSSSSLIESNRHIVRLNGNGTVQVDAVQFLDLLDACRTHVHRERSTCPECRGRLVLAADLYQGTLLQGFFLDDCLAFEEWQSVLREHLQMLAMDVLRDLATGYIQSTDLRSAERYARRQIALDALNEEGYRQLMQIQHLQGERAAAQATYLTCCRILDEELGVEPSAETVDLFDQIRQSHTRSTPAPGLASQSRRILPPALAMESALTPRLLPEVHAPFMGREEELAQIAHRLDRREYRLFSVVGQGGIGKTRFSLEVGRDNGHRFGDGVFFVPLAAVQQGENVAGAIMDALGVAGESGRSTQDRLLATLHPRSLLLILDNVEQILVHESSAEPFLDLLLAILDHAPQVVILVTSRARLNLQSEDILLLKGLSVSDTEDLDGAAQSAAVRLFCDRAHRLQKSFRLDEENAAHVVRICRLAGGMPLAIELATTWVADFSLPQLAEALDRNLDLLRTTQRDVPTQHRSMRGVFEYSWGLLGGADRALLSRLSVFRGGFDLEAAQHVADATPLGLVHLRHKSLLQADGRGRYVMHELLRQFAFEKLTESASDLITIRTKHTDHYLSLVHHQHEVLNGPSPKAGLTVIRDDLDNVRQAWGLASETGATELLERAFPILARFYALTGSYAEAEAAFEQTLAHLTVVDSQATGQMTQTQAGLTLATELTVAVAELAHSQSKERKAIEMATRAIALSQQIGDAASEALASLILALVYLTQGKNDDALSFLDQGIVQAQASGMITLEATLNRHVGNVWRQRGDYDREAVYLEQARTLLERSNDQPQMQTVLHWLGNNAHHRGMYERGKMYIEQGMALNDVVADPSRISKGQDSLGRYETIMGNIAVARRLFEASITVNQRIGDAWQLACSVLDLAIAEWIDGNLKISLAHSRQAQQIAREHNLREMGADSLIILGYTSIDLLDWPAGESYFGDSLVHWHAMSNRVKIVESTVGLAYCLWRQGYHQKALDEVDAILPQLLEQNLYGCCAPLLPHFLAAQILCAHDPKQAAALDQRIDHILHQQADYFTVPHDRARFLTHHPVVRARRRHG